MSILPTAGTATAARTALARMITASRITQAVYVAAKLGIADELATGPRTSEALAAVRGLHPGALRRLLLALASIGIVEQAAGGAFKLTAAGFYLRRDVPDSLYAPTLLFGGDRFWTAWGRLAEAVETGEPTLSRRSELSFLTRHVEDPEWGALFDGAMSAHTRPIIEAIMGAYDFSPFTHVVDIGGGQATLLAAILRAHAKLRGTVMDLAPVADAARRALEDAELGERCAIVSGDFFQSVVGGGDAYLLKMIIHDWDDAHATVILSNCRRAMPEDARLLLIERVMPEHIEPLAEHEECCLVDLNMLVITGGRERTEREYDTLVRRSGFTLTRIIPTTSPFSIIEARPAPARAAG